MLKGYGINMFSIEPAPLKEYDFYTRFNINNYRWHFIVPFIQYYFFIQWGRSV